MPAQVLNNQALKAQIHKLLEPGLYYIRVRKEGAPWSRKKAVNIKCPEYQLSFTKMKCLDESNWAGTENGSDEIVTFWVINADGNAFQKNSREYSGFDDGDEGYFDPKDRYVFPTGESPSYGEIRYYLMLAIQMYEWDWGGAISSSYDELGYVAGELTNVSTGAPLPGAGMALGAIPVVSAHWDALCYIIDSIASALGGDPDGLGTQYLAWSRNDLQWIMGPGETSEGLVNFYNDLDTGSYRLFYKIIRKLNVS